MTDPSAFPVYGRAPLSRRRFLAGGATAMALARRYGAKTGRLSHAASVAPAGADLESIQHVVMVMLENRSFDECFGTYPGVSGFDDHPPGQLGTFSQAWPQAPSGQQPPGRLLPFYLDAATAQAQCAGNSDIPAHDWGTQHESWNRGRMNTFVQVHMATDAQVDSDGNPIPGLPSQGELVMSYMDRRDLPFMWALADNFTLCDHAFCSVMGPTMPNRLMWLSGTIDPDGRAGGPVLITPGSAAQSQESLGTALWTSVPEILTDAGVSWKVYQPPDSSVGPLENYNLEIGFNALLYFKSLLSDPSSENYRNAFLPVWPDEFVSDVRSGTLPQVSWLVPSIVDSMHPSGAPADAEYYLSQIVSALASNPQVWSKTVLFVFFDENGGFFDHVPPPVAPPGTRGEYLAEPLSPYADGIDGPIGLGFRVPLLVVSPYSRGGYVNSDTFDHTSALLFLEKRFGVKVDAISAWRRRTVRDLTSTLDVSEPPTPVPVLPATAEGSPALETECPGSESVLSFLDPAPPLAVPSTLTMPAQEPGTARRRTTA